MSRRDRLLRAAVAVLLVGAADIKATQAQTCLIPTDQIVSGGPGKDGIPALTRPVAVSAEAGDLFLAADDLILGVALNGEARAYPHGILWWHEIINDTLGGQAMTVSYCPLTGSGMVYDAVIDGTAREFGVSGLLFDNNLVMYDRSAEETLWSQMQVRGICGPRAGTAPALLPVVQSTWATWKSLHQDTSVVSLETGFSRNYDVYPYGTYDQISNESLLFPQSVIDARRPPKELVLGITHDGVARAYPYGALGTRSVLNDVINGRPVLVVFDAEGQLALAFDRTVADTDQLLTFELATDGPGFPFGLRDLETGSLWDLQGQALEGPLGGSEVSQIATFSAMWFAWASFHQGTELSTP